MEQHKFIVLCAINLFAWKGLHWDYNLPNYCQPVAMQATYLFKCKASWQMEINNSTGSVSWNLLHVPFAETVHSVYLRYLLRPNTKNIQMCVFPIWETMIYIIGSICMTTEPTCWKLRHLLVAVMFVFLVSICVYIKLCGFSSDNGQLPHRKIRHLFHCFR